jgi:hypothetical protein
MFWNGHCIRSYRFLYCVSFRWLFFNKYLTNISRIIKPFSWLLQSGGQEVEFHEIKIQLFHEIKIAIMRAKFYLFMRSKLTIIFSQFWSGGRHFDHKIETPKSIITNFDEWGWTAQNLIAQQLFARHFWQEINCSTQNLSTARIQ